MLDLGCSRYEMLKVTCSPPYSLLLSRLLKSTIKGTGSLEKDLIKITSQIIEIVLYGIALYYLFQLNTIY